MKNVVEMSFKVLNGGICDRHNFEYSLFSAISKILGKNSCANLHDKEFKYLQILPINGTKHKNMIMFQKSSFLKIRPSLEHLSNFLCLSKKVIRVKNNLISLSDPKIYQLQYSPNLYCHCVIVNSIKESKDMIDFITSTFKEKMNFESKFKIFIPYHKNKISNRILRFKNNSLIGFPIVVKDLNEEDSLYLQSNGFGSKKKFGCGYFNFYHEKENDKMYDGSI